MSEEHTPAIPSPSPEIVVSSERHQSVIENIQNADLPDPMTENKIQSDEIKATEPDSSSISDNEGENKEPSSSLNETATLQSDANNEDNSNKVTSSPKNETVNTQKSVDAKSKENVSPIEVESKGISTSEVLDEEKASKISQQSTSQEPIEESSSQSKPLDSSDVSRREAKSKENSALESQDEEKSEDKSKSSETLQATESTKDLTDNEYAEHITYTEDGNAIYTDPKTKHKYKWSVEQNSWVGFQAANDSESKSSANNPYENEHYRWCTKTQQWIPKTEATETEHYKWDSDKKEWIPKVNVSENTSSSAVVYGVDEDGNRTYTDKDGAVFFWDTDKKAWFPKIDDDFMARYQMSYGFIDNTSALEEERRLAAEKEAQRKEEELKCMAEEAKKGAEETAAGHKTLLGKRKQQEQPKWFDMDPSQNTKVYVWNLPVDITMDEFAELMGKCGMIMRDPKTQKYKLKLYTEEDGQVKGDGLCDYIKVESVDLALKILDEYNYRGNKIRVQRAKFQMRGEYNPALKPKRKKKDKEKLQKLKEKLFDWRPEKMRGERSKNEKIVIIKNLFQPDIFEKEVELILEYQNDLREECSKCGVVRKVVIYDRHPEGVAQVNMSNVEEADLVIQMMHGRFFGKRQLSAEHWDGKTKYKTYESEFEEQKRLSNWDKFLETDEDGNPMEKEATKQSKDSDSPKSSLDKEQDIKPAGEDQDIGVPNQELEKRDQEKQELEQQEQEEQEQEKQPTEETLI